MGQWSGHELKCRSCACAEQPLTRLVFLQVLSIDTDFDGCMKLIKQVRVHNHCLCQQRQN